MSFPPCSIFGAAVAIILLGVVVPKTVLGQIATTQIQVSNADAVQPFVLVPSAELQSAQTTLSPWIVAVGADSIGGAALLELNMTAESALERPTEGTELEAELPPLIPAAGIQVVNADAIGRIDLQHLATSTITELSEDLENAVSPAARIQVVHADSVGRIGLDEVALSASVGANDESESNVTTVPENANAGMPSARIQVTNADAVGRYVLSATGSQANTPEVILPTPAATEQAEPPSQIEAGVTRAVVIADGKLNVRSGPGRDFDIIHQLEVGTQVAVLKQSDDAEWLLVMDDGGLTGWVAAPFVEIVR